METKKVYLYTLSGWVICSIKKDLTPTYFMQEAIEIIFNADLQDLIESNRMGKFATKWQKSHNQFYSFGTGPQKRSFYIFNRESMEGCLIYYVLQFTNETGASRILIYGFNTKVDTNDLLTLGTFLKNNDCKALITKCLTALDPIVTQMKFIPGENENPEIKSVLLKYKEKACSVPPMGTFSTKQDCDTFLFEKKKEFFFWFLNGFQGFDFNFGK